MAIFAKVDTHQPQGEEKRAVLAIRYENVPTGALPFSKSRLTNAVAFGNLGVTNQAKTFGGKREKGTIVYLPNFPDTLIQQVLQGTLLYECHLHCYFELCSLYQLFLMNGRIRVQSLGFKMSLQLVRI